MESNFELTKIQTCIMVEQEQGDGIYQWRKVIETLPILPAYSVKEGWLWLTTSTRILPSPFDTLSQSLSHHVHYQQDHTIRFWSNPTVLSSFPPSIHCSSLFLCLPLPIHGSIILLPTDPPSQFILNHPPWIWAQCYVPYALNTNITVCCECPYYFLTWSQMVLSGNIWREYLLLKAAGECLSHNPMLLHWFISLFS